MVVVRMESGGCEDGVVVVRMESGGCEGMGNVLELSDALC